MTHENDKPQGESVVKYSVRRSELIYNAAIIAIISIAGFLASELWNEVKAQRKARIAAEIALTTLNDGYNKLVNEVDDNRSQLNILSGGVKVLESQQRDITKNLDRHLDGPAHGARYDGER